VLACSEPEALERPRRSSPASSERETAGAAGGNPTAALELFYNAFALFTRGEIDSCQVAQRVLQPLVALA
jgi:hypothetical protein